MKKEKERDTLNTLTNISFVDHIDGPLAPKHLGVEREGRGLGCDRNFLLLVLFSRPLPSRLV